MSDQVMNCSRAEALINQRLDGELSGALDQTLDQHLLSCAHCAREMRLARGLERLLSTLEVPSAEPPGKPPELALPRWCSVPPPSSSRARPAAALVHTVPLTAAALLILAVALSLLYATFLRGRAPTVEVSALDVRFTDRAAIWESLNEDAVAASPSRRDCDGARARAACQPSDRRDGLRTQRCGCAA